MGRYIRKLGRVGHSLGPSEERAFALWVGYEIAGEAGDLSDLGFESAESLSAEELGRLGVATFLYVAPDDSLLRKKLGLPDA